MWSSVWWIQEADKVSGQARRKAISKRGEICPGGILCLPCGLLNNNAKSYLEAVMQSELNRENKYLILMYICGIEKSGFDDLIKQKQRHRRREQTCGHQVGSWSKLGHWDRRIYSIDTMYKTDDEGEPTAEHREPDSVLCGDLMGRKPKNEGTYVCTQLMQPGIWPFKTILLLLVAQLWPTLVDTHGL